ncbi:hypothetical protein P8452_03166 [Trifolium repens]|nr:hypothetical protein P8452_03166 [Trifolium repens]
MILCCLACKLELKGNREGSQHPNATFDRGDRRNKCVGFHIVAKKQYHAPLKSKQVALVQLENAPVDVEWGFTAFNN